MALTEAQKAAIDRAKLMRGNKRASNRAIWIFSAGLVLVVGGGFAWKMQRDAAAAEEQANARAVQELAAARENESFLLALKRWEDAKQLAANSPRIALTSVITSMQAIRSDLMVLKLQGCKAKAQPQYLAAMQGMIDGYLAFMSQSGSDAATARAIAAADSLFTEAAITEGTCVP